MYEVLKEFKKAKTDVDRIKVLQKNKSYALTNLLTAVFNPNIQFNVKEIPDYNTMDNMPPGLSYSNFTEALQKCYIFQTGHPKRNPNITSKVQERVLIGILETLEPKESEVYMNMLFKDLKIPHLTREIVDAAFPGILPVQSKQTEKSEAA